MHSVVAELGGVYSAIMHALGFLGFLFMWSFFNTLAAVIKRKYTYQQNCAEIKRCNTILKKVYLEDKLKNPLKDKAGYEIDFDVTHCSYQETQEHAETVKKLVAQASKDLQ